MDGVFAEYFELVRDRFGGSLYVADKGLLASVNSDTLTKNIPPYLRGPDSQWFAFSKRARIIVVKKTAKDALDIKSYAELVDPKWKGRICSRPRSHVYIASLMRCSAPIQSYVRFFD